MQTFFALILSPPNDNAALRMRTWRTLKASGAAVLRDGVYVLPARDACRDTFDTIATEVQLGGGTAYLLQVSEPEDSNFPALFDRSSDYTQLHNDIMALEQNRNGDTTQQRLKQVRKLRKSFTSLTSIDFFPNPDQQQIAAALQELESAIAQALTPDEPRALINDPIDRLDRNAFQGRTWATRQHPWIDRLASAWLIRRFIDDNARLLWLESPLLCPADALGFDFDGATFTHVGQRVTFEVLLESFALEHPGLKQLGAVVHYLDVGGYQPPEAPGIEAVLAGLCNTIQYDDQLLDTASTVFDGLLKTFAQGTQNHASS